MTLKGLSSIYEPCSRVHSFVLNSEEVPGIFLMYLWVFILIIPNAPIITGILTVFKYEEKRDILQNDTSNALVGQRSGTDDNFDLKNVNLIKGEKQFITTKNV